MRRILAVALALLAWPAQATADENLTPKDVLTVMVRRRGEIRKVCWEQSPEKADTMTLGAVVRPGFIPGLSLSVDWYDIDIKDGELTFDFETTAEMA